MRCPGGGALWAIDAQGVPGAKQYEVPRGALRPLRTCHAPIRAKLPISAEGTDSFGERDTVPRPEPAMAGRDELLVADFTRHSDDSGAAGVALTRV